MRDMDDFWLVVGGIGIGLALGLILCMARVGEAQEPWSHHQYVAEGGVVMDVVVADLDSSGNIIPSTQHQIVAIGPSDPVREAGVDLAPSKSYLVSCGFTLRDPIVYEATAYLPLTVKKR